MVGGGTTNDAIVDLMIMGELDLKYIALGNEGIDHLFYFYLFILLIIFYRFFFVLSPFGWYV
jgi:hypothetical protein